MITDSAWLETDFIKSVQQRGAAIIQARGLSSAKSAAHGVVDTVRSIIEPTPAGEWHSAALYADGSYGSCRIFQLNEFSKARIETSVDELKEERTTVGHLIPSKSRPGQRAPAIRRRSQRPRIGDPTCIVPTLVESPRAV